MKLMAIIVALVVSNTVAFAGTKETKPAATTTTTNVETATKPADPHAAPAVKVKEVAKPVKDSTKK